MWLWQFAFKITFIFSWVTSVYHLPAVYLALLHHCYLLADSFVISFMLFVFQTTNERSQQPSHQLQNTAASVVWYKTPGDETTSISDNCGQKKDQSSALISNMNDSENVDENEDDDYICANSFASSSHLSSHKLAHTGAKAHTCDVCQKSFGRRDCLKRHKLTHSGTTWPKLYPCDVCQARFTQQYHVKIHKRIHTGERPFVCDICANTFKSSSVLTKHKRIHSGTIMYTCDVCNVGFAQMSTLIAHKKTHTGEVNVVWSLPTLFSLSYSLSVCKQTQVS